MYEVEHLDAECASLSANCIAENLFAQVDDEGNGQVLMKEIIDYCTNGQEVKQQDAFITMRTGTKKGGRAQEAGRSLSNGKMAVQIGSH